MMVDTDVPGEERAESRTIDFTLLLPLGGGEPTHVVELCGNQIEFRHALATAIRSGGHDVRPLLLPVDATPLGELADILNSIAEVSVQSIDPVPQMA